MKTCVRRSPKSLLHLQILEAAGLLLESPMTISHFALSLVFQPIFRKFSESCVVITYLLLPALMLVLLLTPQMTNKVLWWSKFMKEISLPMWQTEWWKFVKDQRLDPHWVRHLLSFTAKQPNALKRYANSASELSGTLAIMPLHPTCVPFPYPSLAFIFFVWEVARVSALRER